LVETTAKRFAINEVSADLAYSTHDNLLNVVMAGGNPLIPFKCNATPAQGGLWAKMYHYFNLHRDEFLKRYHLRSNVESTFSAIQRQFGDSLRSKTDVAMKNEVLAKALCHNLCCVIQSMEEYSVAYISKRSPSSSTLFGSLPFSNNDFTSFKSLFFTASKMFEEEGCAFNAEMLLINKKTINTSLRMERGMY
jgi:hypothetical protein